MKKLIAVALCMVLLCGTASLLTGCQEQAQEQAGKLLVGYARADITPDGSYPIGGYNNDLQRISTVVRDPVYATCIAVTAEDGTSMLLYSMDLGRPVGTELANTRKILGPELDIPVESIIEACTHNHHGPSPIVTEEKYPPAEAWHKKLHEAMLQAGRDAWNDRKEATMYYSSIEPVGLNAVRHYVMDDGSINAGNGTGTGSSNVSQVKKADNQLQVVRFDRQTDKDVIMVNWQAHPQEYYWEGNGGNDTTITADAPGAVRDYIEKQLDCEFIYFSGASGNLNTRSMVAGDNVHKNLADYGEKLGKYVLMSLEDAEELQVDTAQTLRKDIYYKDGKIAMNVDVFQLGELGFASAPYEMFDTNGKFIKENSPYKHTFVLYLANGSGTYIADEASYNYGGYEVQSGGFPKGTAEELAEGYVGLLEELYNSTRGGDGNA